MGKITICSVNVGGPNDKLKRIRVAEILRALKVDIICQQETHIPWGKRDILAIKGYNLVICSTQTSTIRGVMIHVRKCIGPAKRVLEDKWGRWAIALLPMGQTICTIYGSNKDDPQIFNDLEIELASWPSPLIICGDLNIHYETDRYRIKKYREKIPCSSGFIGPED